MDYETFGEHQWADTGILEFIEHVPAEVLRSPRFSFKTPAEVAAENDPVARLDIPHPVSWADTERDLTAWLGNQMQRAAHDALYAIADQAAALADSSDAEERALHDKWRRLTTSDHVYYMCTKWFADGDVHEYFSPYASPHDAFISFMNVLDDLTRRVQATREPAPDPELPFPEPETDGEPVLEPAPPPATPVPERSPETEARRRAAPAAKKE